MNKKKNAILRPLLPLSLLFLFLSSCQPGDGDAFLGSYTYKTSGQLSLEIRDSSSCDTIWVNIATEQGQMNVVERDDDDLLVTFNALGGDISVADATADGSTLTLAGRQPKAITLLTLDDTALPDPDEEGEDIEERWRRYVETIADEGQLVSTNVSFRGYGARYDDLLLMDIYYENLTDGSREMAVAILDSRVQCVAKRNK